MVRNWQRELSVRTDRRKVSHGKDLRQPPRPFPCSQLVRLDVLVQWTAQSRVQVARSRRNHDWVGVPRLRSAVNLSLVKDHEAGAPPDNIGKIDSLFLVATATCFPLEWCITYGLSESETVGRDLCRSPHLR